MREPVFTETKQISPSCATSSGVRTYVQEYGVAWESTFNRTR
jgi:hypothetical protein